MESYTENLARELVKRGHIVTIVTSRIGNAPEIENELDGTTIVRLPTRSFIDNRLPLSFKSSRHRRLLKMVASSDVDRVLVNNRFYPHSLVGLQFADSIGAPAILLDHGSDYLTLGNPLIDALIRRYEHLMTARTKRFNPIYCGVSSKSCQWLSRFGINAKLTLPNAIDAAEFRSQASHRDFRSELGIGEECILVASVGRIATEKGSDALVRIAERFGSEKASFALAGDGPLRQSLESHAGSNVHFLGLLSKPDIAALLLSADVFCLPTRSEGFCTALLEAAACYNPSIIPDVGGAAEVTRGSSLGFVIKDRSDATVEQALRKALALGRTQLSVIGSLVCEHIERECTWASTANALEGAFEKAI